MNNDLKKIEINVSGRKYPVRISDQEEASIREIEEQVNDKINEFRLKYTGINQEDCLSMVLLTYAFDLHKSANYEFDKDIQIKLDKIESALNEALL